MDKKTRRGRGLYLIPVLGTVLCIGYILAATRDVVYSDYIRLINSYLPDVWNPEKFFVADIFTRMPVNFLERIVNVSLFGYSTTFEMVLGALFLGAAGVVLTMYCRRRQIGTGWYLVLMAVFFSLNKWEMLTNGTGWCHFLAFAGFYYHYFLWDRVWSRQMGSMETGASCRLVGEQERDGDQVRNQDRRDRKLLMLLPWLITLGTAGPYCGAYSAILILTYGVCFLLDWRRRRRPDYRHLIYMVHVLLPLGLYLLSNTFAVEEHAGSTGRSIGQVLGDNWMLFPKFIVKSLSSMVVGSEVLLSLLERLNQGMGLCYLAGLVVLAGYLLALWMQLRHRLYEVSVFPLMFILWGGLNHLLVLAARWIFENSDYGMSSRYALQFQVGILGILLTFALVFRRRMQRKQGESRRGKMEPGKMESEKMEPGKMESGKMNPGKMKSEKMESGKMNPEKMEQRKRAAENLPAGTFLTGTLPVRLEYLAAVCISLVILAGNGYTTYKEIEKAPNRREYAMQVEAVALGYRDAADDELEAWFQYHHGPEKIRQALRILEENQWNIYGGH